MDRVTKFLKRLNKNEQEALEKTLRKIEEGNLSELDIKKIKGVKGLFRVRKGSIRIIFEKEKSATNIISIERRSEDTYKNL